MILTDPYEIAKFIKDSVKKTEVKAYVNLVNKHDVSGDFKNSKVLCFGADLSYILIGDYSEIQPWLEKNTSNVKELYIENDARNSAIDMLDKKSINARIEPGAVIRDHVTIGDNAVIMMGAVINIGSNIGSGTMIDMGAVLGARAHVGKNSHVGAGSVIAGVLEPPSKEPVMIGDNVLIGANAVILEGVTVGNGAVIGAGSVVTKNVGENEVVVGNPAKAVKIVDESVKAKSEILEDLR